MATKINLTVPNNSAFTFAVQYCQALPGTNPPQPDPSNPVPVTGYAAAMTIKANAGGRVLATLTSANGAIVVGGSNGLFTVTISYAVSRGLAAGVWDMVVTPPAGDPIRIAEGGITVDPGVTIPV